MSTPSSYRRAAEGVPLLHLPLLGDPKVGSIDRHQAVVADVVDEASIEIDLQFCEGGGKKRGQGGRDDEGSREEK